MNISRILLFFCSIYSQCIIGANNFGWHAPLSENNRTSIVFSYNTPSDWDSFSADSYLFSAGQENAASMLNGLMQPSFLESQWITLANELKRRDLLPLFEANLKSLNSDLETICTFSTFYCPSKIESSAWLGRRWSNFLDLIHGTKNIDAGTSLAKMVDSIITFCISSFTNPQAQQLLTEYQINLKPLLFDSDGRIRTQLTDKQLRQWHEIETVFKQKLGQWYSENALIQCAHDALNSTKQFKNPHNIVFPQEYRKSGELSPVFADLAHRSHFKNLLELKNFCDQGNFEKAYQIVEKYNFDPEGPHSFGNKNYYTEYYLQRFRDHIAGNLPDFSIPGTSSQERIKTQSMNFIASIRDSLVPGSRDYGRVVKISQIYTRMMEEKNQACEQYLAGVFRDGHVNYVLLDNGLICESYKSIDPSMKEAFHDRNRKIIELYKNDPYLENRHIQYNKLLDTTSKMYCIAHGIPYERYEQFEGNPLQFELFKIDRTNLEKGAELYAAQMNQTLRKVYEFGVQSNFLTHSFIKGRDYVHAIDLTTLAYKTFDYVDKACNSAGYLIVETTEGIAEGFKEMPVRLQDLIESTANFQQEFRQLLVEQSTQKSEWNLSKIFHPATITHALRDGCSTIKDKFLSFATNTYQMGPRKVAKQVTQYGIEAALLYSAEQIMQQGVRALAFEAEQITQSPNPLTKSQTAQRFIVDAEITQIEATVTSSETKNWDLPDVSPLVKVEETVTKTLPIQNINTSAVTTGAIQKTRNSNVQPAVIAKEILSPGNEALIKNFNPVNYNPGIINPEMLSKAVEQFAHTKGALGENGPLRQVLINGKIEADSKMSLKGPVYEIEKALELTNRGEQIVEFGKKIKTREFDIITFSKLIECKNINWDSLDINKIGTMKSSFGDQNSIAKELGLSFEIHSKNSIPENFKQWFKKNKIHFVEG